MLNIPTYKRTQRAYDDMEDPSYWEDDEDIETKYLQCKTYQAEDKEEEAKEQEQDNGK